MKFFVILVHQNGLPIPMLDGAGGYDLALFDSEKEATDAARATNFGHAFGYNVIAWRYGVVDWS